MHSPKYHVKYFIFLVTFIGLQALGSMSFLYSSSQASISLDTRDNKYLNEKKKGDNLSHHVNLKNLKEQNNDIGTLIDKGNYCIYIKKP